MPTTYAPMRMRITTAGHVHPSPHAGVTASSWTAASANPVMTMFTTRVRRFGKTSTLGRGRKMASWPVIVRRRGAAEARLWVSGSSGGDGGGERREDDGDSRDDGGERSPGEGFVLTADSHAAASAAAAALLLMLTSGGVPALACHRFATRTVRVADVRLISDGVYEKSSYTSSAFECSPGSRCGRPPLLRSWCTSSALEGVECSSGSWCERLWWLRSATIGGGVNTLRSSAASPLRKMNPTSRSGRPRAMRSPSFRRVGVSMGSRSLLMYVPCCEWQRSS